MKIFLHEFPSIRGRCWEHRSGIWIISFDYLQQLDNTTVVNKKMI